MKLSICSIALNEEALIGGMLLSVQKLADERVAIECVLGLDSRTSDDTRGIAQMLGAKTFDFDWRDDFSYARNLTIDAATGDWILVLDADERLLPAGAAAVRDVLECASPEPAADAVTGCMFLIAQRDLAGTLKVIQRSSGRLFRRRPEIRYRGIVHEEPVWLPEPSRTSWVLITGEPHIDHVGYDPELWRDRAKYERNRGLLEQRLAADPTDAYAREKLRALEAIGA